jgi:class 3 adenylate cyclase/tetratricopeptide (TPR) repeat protein
VNCTNCGAENRPGRRFCLKCGNALASGCPNCGAENEAEAAFCGNCGTGLGLPATVEPRSTSPTVTRAAERRLVTVLFADLVGFTPFAEERDAEDVRDTLERYGAIAREVVQRYGGTVEKFIGDAVMAVWGTPTAHEDDAERAVRAALELIDAVRELGQEIQARAGVLTGEAAVNMAATDQSLLAGDLVNTAARLQSVAPPGSVLVGEATMRATSSSVAYEAVGAHALKGKQSPVPAWQALRVVAQRRGARRSESVETPFVGREEEFRLLRDQLHLTGRDPRLRLVSITGPAGIGKSRLAWELEKYIDGIVETIYWHRGRCPSYGEGISFWALGEMVRRRAGLAETDNETTTRERVRATVDEYVTEPDERDWINGALLVLLGVEQQSEGGRETLFAAWRRFFENVAALGTTVLVFEDVHWADPGLLDFIDHLLDWSKSAPLLVVTLARPELFDRRPDWGAGRRTFSALPLDPMPEPAMREMLLALVPDLPAAALSAIVARADGIPLYAVETVRMLLADGRLAEGDGGGYRTAAELGDLEVPDSLRSLITSRLDGLDPPDRKVIQDAAVLGQTFSVGALAELTGQPGENLEARLRQLVRRELLTLELDPRSPERGQFGFTQSLVREVAYSTLTRPQRRERHLAAARHLESSGGDELAGVLAGHYLAAYQASAPGAEADAVAAQARIALRAAADRASALGGHKQAADYLTQALAVTNTDGERAQLLERSAEEFELTGRYDTAEKAIRAAIEGFRGSDDAASLARSRARLGQILVGGGHEGAAVAELQEALSELPTDVEPRVRAELLSKLARALYRTDNWAAAIPVADEALAIAERHRLTRILAEALVSKGSALWTGTRITEAVALLRAGLELARRVGDSQIELRAAANLSLGLISEEGPPEALRVTRAALETARRVGDFPQVVWQTTNAAFYTFFSGEALAQPLAEVDDLLALDLAGSDRANLLRARAALIGLLAEDVEPTIAEYLSFASPEAQKVSVYRFGAAIARGDYAAATRFGEQANNERPELGLAGPTVWTAVMSRDLENSRRLLGWMDRAPMIGRLDTAQRVVAHAAVAALEGRIAEAMPNLRSGMAEMEELGDLYDYGIAALALIRAVGPEVPEARDYAVGAVGIFERMGSEPLAAQVRRELAVEHAAARASRPSTPVASAPAISRE